MKTLAFLCLLQLGFGASALGSEGTLEALNWLIGQWVRESDTRMVSERWSEVSGSVFAGTGTSIDRQTGKETLNETLLIVEMQGDIFYLAKTRANSLPVPFRLVSLDANHAIFENLNHDFPKRLHYQLVDEHSLTVDVSDAGERGFRIQYHRKD